jgi:hypothetical protein
MVAPKAKPPRIKKRFVSSVCVVNSLPNRTIVERMIFSNVGRDPHVMYMPSISGYKLILDFSDDSSMLSPTALCSLKMKFAAWLSDVDVFCFRLRHLPFIKPEFFWGGCLCAGFVAIGRLC